MKFIYVKIHMYLIIFMAKKKKNLLICNLRNPNQTTNDNQTIHPLNTLCVYIYIYKKLAHLASPLIQLDAHFIVYYTGHVCQCLCSHGMWLTW